MAATQDFGAAMSAHTIRVIDIGQLVLIPKGPCCNMTVYPFFLGPKVLDDLLGYGFIDLINLSTERSCFANKLHPLSGRDSKHGSF